MVIADHNSIARPFSFVFASLFCFHNNELHIGLNNYKDLYEGNMFRKLDIDKEIEETKLLGLVNVNLNCYEEAKQNFEKVANFGIPKVKLLNFL